MDLEARNRLNKILEEELGPKFVSVVPAEYEFSDYEGPDQSMAKTTTVKIFDIATHAHPGEVLEAMSSNLMLNGEAEDSRDSPYRYLGAISNGTSTTLTFEDVGV